MVLGHFIRGDRFSLVKSTGGIGSRKFSNKKNQPQFQGDGNLATAGVLNTGFTARASGLRLNNDTHCGFDSESTVSAGCSRHFLRGNGSCSGSGDGNHGGGAGFGTSFHLR